MGIPPVRLLDKVRQFIRLKGYSIRNEPDCCPGRQREKGPNHCPAGRRQTGLKGASIRKIVRNCQACWLSYAEALCRLPDYAD